MNAKLPHPADFDITKYIIRDLHEIKNRKLRRNKIVARRKILKQIILQIMNNKDVGPIFFTINKA